MKIQNFSLAFIVIVLVIYLLYIAQSLFIPLVIAILIWYIILALKDIYAKIKISSFQLPSQVAMILSFATFALLGWIFIGLVNQNIQDVIVAAPAYQSKFQTLIQNFTSTLHLENRLTLQSFLEWANLTTIATTLAGIITTLAGYASIITLYVLFLLLEYNTFPEKLAFLIPDHKRRENFILIINKISRDLNTYLKIKTFISLITAILCYIILSVMQVRFASFWAVLIFVLNFIPNIGSIITVILPVLFSLVQFDMTYSILLAILLTSVNFIIGGMLEPRFMGKSLNLSPFVILVSLVVWGYIWGIVGLFLCVPIMVSINIILARFPGTRPIAILLSSKGDIDKADNF